MEAYIGQIVPFAFSWAPQDTQPCNGESLPVNQYQALFSLISTLYGGSGTTSFNVPDLRGRTMFGYGPYTGPEGQDMYSIAEKGGRYALTRSSDVIAHTHGAAFSASTGQQSVTIPGKPGTPATPPKLTAAQLQVNPAAGATNTPTATNTTISGSPGGNAGATMWSSSLGSTPTTVNGLTVTLDPGSAGTPTIPDNTVNITTVTGGTVAVTGTGSAAVDIRNPYLAINFVIVTNGYYPSRP
ncbi:MAG: phage tail protein [Alphaproteobacteria bacterium]